VNTDQLVGYRKVIVWLVSIGVTYAINKGMPPEVADSLGGIVVQALPTAAAAIFSYFNVASKKATANETATLAATLTPMQQPAQQQAEAQDTNHAPQQQPQEITIDIPPVADTMPPFSAEDDCLTMEQRQSISEWYAKATTSPPKVPDIPAEPVRNDVERRNQNERRSALASQDLMKQAITLFDTKEWTRVLQMRKNCSPEIWERVNYHWRMAMARWMSYGLLLWKYVEHIPTL
jgi:hypothetical protein